MKHKYLCSGLTKDNKVVMEVFKSETRRPSKVVKLVDKAFMKKFGYFFTDLKNTSIGILDKHFRIPKLVNKTL